MPNDFEIKHCKNCQTLHKKEFEALCKICSSNNDLVNFCPKINKFESFINPYAIIFLILMAVHLIALIVVVQGKLVPVLVSLGLWIISYFCLAFNDLAWKFSMYRVKQRHKLELYESGR
jgi:uncharacterized paraquat-inducible protein A